MRATGALEELLRGARRRVLHFLAALTAGVALVTREVMAMPCEVAYRLEPIVWIAGCSALAVLANLGYRARRRSSEILLEAVRLGRAIRHVEVSHLRLLFVPVGSEVDLEVTDASGTHHLAFGFWTRASAERLIGMLDPLIVGRRPPARPAVPPARVVSFRAADDDHDRAR